MLDEANLPEILPPRQLTHEEYLDQKKGEVRAQSRVIVAGIVMIGRILVEAKEEVGHGKYEKWVREELGYSPSTALNYVRSYELFNSVTGYGFEPPQIDARSLYRLAAPSTPREVRAEFLEKATSPEGISKEEVAKLVAEATAAAAARAKTEAESDAAAQLSAANKTSEAEAKIAAEQSASLTEQIRRHEVTIAQKGQRIAELEGAAAMAAQQVRAEYGARYEGKLALSEDEVQTRIDAITAPLNTQIAALSKPRDEAVDELDDVRKKQPAAIEAAAKKAAVEAEALKKPPPPFDTELPLKAIEARQAIAHCVAEIELTPAEFIETAIRLQQWPDLAREVLGQMAIAIRRLTPWYEKFIELYEKEINRDPARNEVAPAIADVPLATPPEAEPAKTLTKCLQVTERPALFVATPEFADQRENAVPPKRGRGRPVGSQDKQPRQKKSTRPPIIAKQSPDYRRKLEIKAAQSNTDNPESFLLDRAADNLPRPCLFPRNRS
jgi:DUF3102 family protein